MTQYPPPGARDSVPPSGSAPGSWPAPGAPTASPPPAPGSYGQLPPAGPAWAPPGPWGPPVHQPGVVPLRPLTLGDIFGGAIQTVRLNPRATVVLAAVVTFAFMLIPMLGTLLLGLTDGLPSLDPLAEDSASSTLSGDLGFYVSSLVSGVFSMLSSLVVTGLIVQVVEGALVGRKLTAGESWRRTRGRLLPLLGLTLLVGLVLALVVAVPVALGVVIGLVASSNALAVLLGVLGGVAGLVSSIFLYTRYVLLSAPVLVLEGRGILASLKRSGQLSRNQFWRLLGIFLLAGLAGYMVSQVIAIPFAVIGFAGIFVLPDNWGLVGMLLATNLSTVLTGALIGPFSSGVTALQYFDQRFRKEGLDIQLLHQSLQSGPR